MVQDLHEEPVETLKTETRKQVNKTLECLLNKFVDDMKHSKVYDMVNGEAGPNKYCVEVVELGTLNSSSFYCHKSLKEMLDNFDVLGLGTRRVSILDVIKVIQTLIHKEYSPTIHTLVADVHQSVVKLLSDCFDALKIKVSEDFVTLISGEVVKETEKNITDMLAFESENVLFTLDSESSPVKSRMLIQPNPGEPTSAKQCRTMEATEIISEWCETTLPYLIHHVTICVRSMGLRILQKLSQAVKSLKTSTTSLEIEAPTTNMFMFDNEDDGY